jgi:hypothetical protein
VANKIAPRMERRGGGGINLLAEIVEPAMTAGSNILAEIPAYAAGMAELNKTGLPSEGVRRAEEVSERLTYNPRTMEGQAGLQSLTNGVMRVMDTLGVDEAINYLNNTIVPNLQRTFGEEGAREIGSSVMMALPFVRKVPSMKAFHGSPHDFDKFSMDAIGTGEGAQAYGHGLYAGEAQGTGFQYYKQGLEKNLNRPLSMVEEAVAKKKASGLSPMDAMGELADEGWEFDGIQKSLDTIYNNPARFYQVEIDASPDEFLDWDKLLDDQPEILNKIRATDWGEYAEEGAKDLAANMGQNPGGDTLHRWLAEDGADFAAEQLSGSGIKGIKYKDGFSRGADGGTSNYVIFDDRLISIAKKYGIAIPAAAALLSQETGLNPSSLYEEDNPV